MIAGLTIDIAGDVTVGVSSPADLAGDVTVSVASPADLAGVVTAGVAFREECGDNVVIPTDCVCNYDEIAEVTSSANLAGDVTVGVTSSADPASVVTAGVAFREECGDNVVVPVADARGRITRNSSVRLDHLLTSHFSFIHIYIHCLHSQTLSSQSPDSELRLRTPAPDSKSFQRHLLIQIICPTSIYGVL